MMPWLQIGQLGIRRPTAAVAFTPASLFAASEKGYWLDPNDFTTMFQDAAGTIPVTAAGQPVGRWVDKSGNGNVFSIGTAAFRPVLTLDGTTGHHYLLFDGSNDRLDSASTINLTATDKLTLAIGVYIDTPSVSPSYILETGTNYTSPSGGYGLIPDVAGASEVGFAGSGTGAAYYRAPLPYAARYTITCNYDIAGAAIAQEIVPRINEATPSLTVGSAGPMGTGNFGNTATYIGARGGGASGQFKGRIYGLIVRGATTSGATLTDLENYLQARCGSP